MTRGEALLMARMLSSILPTGHVVEVSSYRNGDKRPWAVVVLPPSGSVVHNIRTVEEVARFIAREGMLAWP